MLTGPFDKKKPPKKKVSPTERIHRSAPSSTPESLWLEELMSSKSMQHGLHPEDEAELLDSVLNPNNGHVPKTEIHINENLNSPMKAVKPKNPVISLGALFAARDSILKAGKSMVGSSTYYDQLLKEMAIP